MTDFHHCAYRNVFDIGVQKYTTSICFDQTLQPDTVTSENFVIYDGSTGHELVISDTVYLPQNRMAYISVQSWWPPAVNCRIRLSDAIKSIDGEPITENELDGVLVCSYATDAYGMGVKNVRIIQNGKVELYPDDSSEIELRVLVVNASDTEQTQKLLLYLNDDIDTPLVEDSVTVSSNSEKEFVYTISGFKWSNEDLLYAEILS